MATSAHASLYMQYYNIITSIQWLQTWPDEDRVGETIIKTKQNQNKSKTIFANAITKYYSEACKTIQWQLTDQEVAKSSTLLSLLSAQAAKKMSGNLGW